MNHTCIMKKFYSIKFNFKKVVSYNIIKNEIFKYL